MVKLGENVFPWAVAEALGGQDAHLRDMVHKIVQSDLFLNN